MKIARSALFTLILASNLIEGHGENAKDLYMQKVNISSRHANTRPRYTTLHTSKYRQIDAVAVTGFNRRKEFPVWDLGEPFNDAGFDFVFEHVPGVTESPSISSKTPMSAVIATGVDSNYLSFVGLSLEQLNYDFINVPLAQSPVMIDGEGNREKLTSITQNYPDDIGKSLPNRTIRLYQWLNAKGRARYRCLSEGAAITEFYLSNLVPDGVYTAWAIFSSDNDSNGIVDSLKVTPFAGIPNVIVANSIGSATMRRTIDFCPDLSENFLMVEFDYHSDGQVYGASPDYPKEGFLSGIVTHSQLEFPFHINRY